MNLRCELSELLLRACVSCLISSVVIVVAVFAEEDRLAVLQSFVLPKPVYPLASIERGALTRNKNNKPPSRNFAVLNHLCSAFRSSNERRHRAAETESEWRQVSSAVHLQDQVETSVKVIIIETAKLRSAQTFPLNLLRAITALHASLFARVQLIGEGLGFHFSLHENKKFISV